MIASGSLSGATDSVQSLSVISQTAKSFLQDELSTTNGSTDLDIRIGRLDPRLRLKPCELPLEAFWPYKPGNYKNVSIGVRCPGVRPWKVFLRPDMIAIKPVDVLQLNGTATTEYTHLLGRAFRKPVRAGTPLTPNLFAVPDLVIRDEYVKIQSASTALQVEADGTALSNGTEGQIIAVKNNTSGKIVHALVVGRSIVRVIQ